MSQGFVHLRLHTEYSLSDSVVRIPELVAAVAAAGMAAVAVTDQNNLFAMVKFYREALRSGLKPLVGIDLWVAEEGERAAPTRLTLLCQSQAGYRNLARLVTRAYLEGQQRGVPRVERRWLSMAALEGLIALSGAQDGDLGRALVNAREHDAESSLDAWLELFPGRFYLELQRLGRPFEEAYIAAAAACRWSQPTMCAFSKPRSSSHTRRASASTRARCSRTPAACAAIRASSTCAPRRR